MGLCTGPQRLKETDHYSGASSAAPPCVQSVLLTSPKQEMVGAVSSPETGQCGASLES